MKVLTQVQHQYFDSLVDPSFWRVNNIFELVAKKKKLCYDQ